jgi:alpha-tubulin suppressor-like RCC1 family protein
LQVASTPGAGFQLVLQDTGLVYGTGVNPKGQLGMNDTINRVLFTKNPFLSQITQITTGQAHALFLDRSNNVYASGDNSVSFDVILIPSCYNYVLVTMSIDSYPKKFPRILQ